MGILISTAMIVSADAALTLVPLLVKRLQPAFVARRSAFTAAIASRAALLVLAGAGAGLAAPPANAQDPSAEEIMRKNRAVDKVVGSHSNQSMKLRNKQGQERLRESISATKLQANGLDNQRLTRFLAPAEVKGTAILLVEHSKAENNMWIHLPGLKKVRRLVASNKGDSFAGTDFSYGDVIGHTVEDWSHKIIGEDNVLGELCYVVESTPDVKRFHVFDGSCHCGAIGFTFRTSRRSELWPLRACQCSFCRRHGARTTSDPEGSVTFRIADATRLQRYRFGLHSAEFLICKSCGVYLASVMTTARGQFATVNVNAIRDPIIVRDAKPVSYDGESLAGAPRAALDSGPGTASFAVNIAESDQRRSK